MGIVDQSANFHESQSNERHETVVGLFLFFFSVFARNLDDPTDQFRNYEPQIREMDEFYVVKECRATVFEAPKL